MAPVKSVRTHSIFAFACLLFFVGLANAMAGTTTPCDEGKSGEESRVLRSTVAIVAPESQAGGGVIIDKDEALIPAHLISGKGRPVLVITCDGEMIFGAVTWVDLTLDLALVKMERELPVHFRMRSKAHPVHVGESVRTVGQPNATPWAVSAGMVIGSNQRVIIDFDREVAEYSLIVSSAKTTKGGSGGALVDADGDLVGVVIASLDHGSFAVAQSMANFCKAYAHSRCR